MPSQSSINCNCQMEGSPESPSIVSVEFEQQPIAKSDNFDHNSQSLALPRHQEARKSSEVSSNEVAVEEEDEGQSGSEEKRD